MQRGIEDGLQLRACIGLAAVVQEQFGEEEMGCSVSRVVLERRAQVRFGFAIAAAKQTRPNSKGEMEALQALFGAQDPDARIKAADNLVTNFADSDFKDIALFFAAVSEEQKGDSDKAIIYGERAVEALTP